MDRRGGRQYLAAADLHRRLRPPLSARAFKTGGGARRQDRGMRFDTKIAIAVRDDLEQWQKLNLTSSPP